MVADRVAFGVRRAAFESTTLAEAAASAEGRTPNAKRQTPTTERCPACGQQRPRAELVHKGVRLVCCAACYWARRHAGRVRWEEANRARRLRAKREGGQPCPAYVAWTVDDCGSAGAIVSRDPQAPDAVVLPAYGACSCGEAGCVHLVVACLAQQGGGGDG